MKKATACLAALAMMLALFPIGVRAAGTLDSSVFTEWDLRQGAAKDGAVEIRLTESTAECSSPLVQVDGSTVTITGEGIYLLSGVLTNGQICIDAEKTDKVQLVLDGVQLASLDSAAILVKKAEKVCITLAEGSENYLANGGSFTGADDSKVDGVIYSKADLSLNGSGKLNVNAKAGNGIVSKDALKITGGDYIIEAENHGLTGKDYIAIAGGSFRIHSGADGIHAKNGDDAELGYLYIAGGSFEIESGDEGISATGMLQIDSGSFQMTTGGGSENGRMNQSDAAGQFGRGWGRMEEQTTDDGASAGKGIKADGDMVILGGSYILDCADDAVHGNGNVTISGGSWEIRTADDGIHAETALIIEDGTFVIPYCYEGMEGETVTVNGGTIQITAVDDGINAAGGADGSGYWGPMGGGNSSSSIVINGGNITIVSDGDCLDSNGTLTLNGGKLNLTCGGYGNTAIDYESEYTNNGADVTTNDGSENGTGMHGGMGHGGGFFGGQRPDGFQGGENGLGGQRPDGFQGRGDVFGGQRPDGGRNPFGGNVG